MAAVYARFKDPKGRWGYSKIGKGRPPKDASFHVRFTDATGKRRWSQPFPSVEAANANSEGVKVASIAASKGLTVNEYSDVLNAGKTTIKDAVAQFLKLNKRKRPKTVQQYSNALNHLLAHLPNGMRFVGDLATADALDAYLEILEADGFAKKTVHTRMGVIFSLLKDHVRETGVEYASKLVSVARPVKQKPRAYSDGDIKKLFEKMTEEEWERYAFFLSTGCREQEVMYATWDDVDFTHKTYKVEGKDDVNFVPKNHEVRVTPMTTEVCEMLRERRKKAKGRWIFSAEGGKPEGHFLRKFKAIAKRAGLNCGACKTKIMDGKFHLRKVVDVTCETRPVCEKHYLHRLRKTAATRWLHNGINIRKIQSWLGHSSLEVTQLYLDDVSPSGDDEQSKIDKAGRLRQRR
ncbi:MAG TPA: site-specific integrase [Candidatus Saccharimonadales bacterium]|nr:site-specific integrase [Candidatus Saccharimonadales bacterium]